MGRKGIKQVERWEESKEGGREGERLVESRE